MSRVDLRQMPVRDGNIIAMLNSAVASHPNRAFLRSRNGEITYAAMAAKVEIARSKLADAGVRRGDAVGLVMETSIEQVATWFALSSMGALHVPMNPSLLSVQLADLFARARLTAVVVDGDCLDKVLEAMPGAPGVKQVMVQGSSTSESPLVSRWHALRSHPRAPFPATVAGDDLDTATLLFTSGSTARPKPCGLSHRYMARQGQLHAKNLRLRPDDVLYTPFPLFHIDGANLTVVAAMAAGCSAALSERFSVSRFWDEIRAFGATVFNFMGATLTMLHRQPRAHSDRDHSVRLAWGVPMPEWHEEWEPRFGFPLIEVFGSTEAGVPAYDSPDEPHEGDSCGRITDDYEVITVDELGQETSPGQVGEIWVRGREPGLVMNGYHLMPEATAAATAPGGWVRTGDLGSITPDARLRFHARLSDSIRRRGENIAATEVERLVATHPEIAEVAAIGVPSDLTEEDVKAFVLPRVGAESLDARDVLLHCQKSMPRFLVPRYIEVVRDLPRTPTAKVDKPALRAQRQFGHELDTDPHSTRPTHLMTARTQEFHNE